MTVGFNRKWIGSAVIFLILLSCCIIGIYTFLTREILVEDGKMSDRERNFFIAAFICIGVASATALIKLVTRVKGTKGCFTVDENGISDTIVLFNIFTLYFIFDIKNIPWKAVKSIETEQVNNFVNAKIDKNYLNEIKASPLAKTVIKYFGYSFGHGLADMNSSEIADLCNKYRQ